MADDAPQTQLREQVRELERRLNDTREELAAVKEQRPSAVGALGLDTPMGRRQAMALGILGGGAGIGALTAASEPAQADAVAADVGTEADPWQKVWTHAIESGDGADVLTHGDAIQYANEAVSSGTTIGNVTFVYYDSSVAGFTITIPASLEKDGVVLYFIDTGGSAASNNVDVTSTNWNVDGSGTKSIDASNTAYVLYSFSGEWRSQIFTERVDAGTIATETLVNDRHYAGGYPGADPDARLSAAISAASNGDLIYLEARQYESDRTISKDITLLGTATFSTTGTPSEIDTATWTLDSPGISLEYLGVRNTSGTELVLAGNTVKVTHINVQGSGGTVTVSGDRGMLGFVQGGGTVTFEAGTSGGAIAFVDGNITVTDNGDNADLSEKSGLTASDSSTVDATYGTEERDVIQNLRTRVNEIEDRLQSAGQIQ